SCHSTFPLSFPTRLSSDLPGLDISRRHYLRQVERRAADRQRAGLDQLVVAIEVGQVAHVPARRQVGDVRIPVEQVERGIVLAHQDRKSTRLNSSHVEISYA